MNYEVKLPMVIIVLGLETFMALGFGCTLPHIYSPLSHIGGI